MHPQIRFLVAALCLSALAPLHAQVTQADVKDAAKVMSDAAVLREDIADSITKGSSLSTDRIAQLKGTANASGLKIDSDADFAFAALDVGQRLIAAGKPAEAEAFFREAEKSLDKIVKKTPDTAANDKVQFLSALALLHARYLNNAAQAKADLDAAIKLKPDDKHLEGLRGTLGKEHGEVFNERPANDGKKSKD